MRYGVSLLVGVFVSIALFLLMYQLIDNDHPAPKPPKPLAVVERIDLKNVPEEPPEVDEIPEPFVGAEAGPIPDIDMPTLPQGEPPNLWPEEWEPDEPIKVAVADRGGVTLDGVLRVTVPIVPMFPRECALKGAEGIVEVEYTVFEDGSVGEVDIVAHENGRCFFNEVRRAMLRGKFVPPTKDGKPIRVRTKDEIIFRLIDYTAHG